MTLPNQLASRKPRARLARLVVLTLVCTMSSVCATAFGDPPHPAATSPLVYPARPRGIVMSHATPAHRELSCTKCHEAGAPPSRGKREPALVPHEASCRPCHEQRTDRANASAQACGFCHRGFDPQRSPNLAAVRAEPARLLFSHARHARAEVPCARCHGEPMPTGSADPTATPTMPSMAACLDCHSGAPRRLACNGCHVASPAGLLRTRFPEGKLVPKHALPALTHDADFIVRHRWLAADEAPTCKACHTEKDCTDCHDGVRRPRGIHPNDYLALHAQEAERNAQRCSSCHTTQSFCLPCHARLGISPLSAPDLASPKRFHPPGAIWVRGPALHAREATRALSTCVSCHAERDCVVCHGAQGVGGGVSPHPPGFRSECSARLAASPRACATCHVDVDALRPRCR